MFKRFLQKLYCALIPFLIKIKILKPRYFYISQNGNDSNDGRSPRTARKTLAAIEKLTRPDDTVLIAPSKKGEMITIIPAPPS